MSRIENTFKTLSRPALITFIMAGDPDLKTSLDVLKILPKAGADLIEIGMPFTDPVADGPVIQLAGQRALNAGANMVQTLSMVREFRKENQTTPIILMGYANPVHAFGADTFLKEAQNAGVDGLILVDLPPEEDDGLSARAKAHDIDLIRLITPTTTPERLGTLLQGAGGFLYYVSITGVTGAAKADPQSLKPHLDAIRTQTKLPLAVGFGIRTPDDAAAMGAVADAVVVGSAIVQTMADGKPNAPARVEAQVKALAEAVRKIASRNAA